MRTLLPLALLTISLPIAAAHTRFEQDPVPTEEQRIETLAEQARILGRVLEKRLAPSNSANPFERLLENRNQHGTGSDSRSSGDISGGSRGAGTLAPGVQSSDLWVTTATSPLSGKAPSVRSYVVPGQGALLIVEAELETEVRPLAAGSGASGEVDEWERAKRSLTNPGSQGVTGVGVARTGNTPPAVTLQVSKRADEGFVATVERTCLEYAHRLSALSAGESLTVILRTRPNSRIQDSFGALFATAGTGAGDVRLAQTGIVTKIRVLTCGRVSRPEEVPQHLRQIASYTER